MDLHDFRTYAHQLVDWLVDYQENITSYDVKSQVKPEDIIQQLPLLPPQESENFSTIFNDFLKIIMPGVTHWQHPCFFAYYPATTSPPSILAEMIVATLGLQCMSWQTSPAATELEERMMQWLAQMIGLPEGFTGVIQDSASSATLVSLLTARERKTNYKTNRQGLYRLPLFTMYCSLEAHSAIEKAVKIAGLGNSYLRKIDVDENYAMRPDDLEKAIAIDIAQGYVPLWVVASIGTTGSTAIDPLKKIGEICQRYDIWLHVDAAYAGTALLLPELRYLIDGIEYVDSFVFNPHKWMLTNFDCSAYFVKDKHALLKCLSILPEFLKTKEETVTNYRDWGIPLGRRFRALKLWFVIRSYGVKNLQTIIRQQLQLTKFLKAQMSLNRDFEIMAPVLLNNICFRYHPKAIQDTTQLNHLNELLLENLNSTGKVYLSHTRLRGQYVLRLVIGQLSVKEKDIADVWGIIQKEARKLATVVDKN